MLEPGGVLVSSVAAPDAAESARRGVRGVFFLVSVTTTGLERLACLFESGELAGGERRQYLAELRIERAQEMLTHSDLPVVAVAFAFAAGFGSQSRFTHAFRRAPVLTPAAYRRRR